MENTTKLQDMDGNWYWIPNELVEKFNKEVNNLSGMMYLDFPTSFDNFTLEFGKYATGGDEDLVPPYFQAINPKRPEFIFALAADIPGGFQTIEDELEKLGINDFSELSKQDFGVDVTDLYDIEHTVTERDRFVERLVTLRAKPSTSNVIKEVSVEIPQDGDYNMFELLDMPFNHQKAIISLKKGTVTFKISIDSLFSLTKGSSIKVEIEQ